MNRAVARYATPADPARALLEKHAPLLARCARRLASRTGGAVSPDDLWSAGAMGLLDAAQRFDAGQNVRFESFAEHRIRGAMLDEMRRMDHLPRRLRARTDEVEQARARLGRALGRDPGADEVAEAMGAEPEEVAELLQLLAPPMPVDEELPGSADDVVDALARRQDRARLVAAIRGLPDRLQTLLALYYDEELTYREIAKILSVSEPRVCQLHSEAVKKIREALATQASGDAG